MSNETKPLKRSIIALDAITPVNPEPSSPKRPSKDKLLERRSLYSIPGKQQISADRISAAVTQLNTGRYELWADVCQGAMTDPMVMAAYNIRRAAVCGRPYTVSAPKDVLAEYKDDAERLANLVKLWLMNMDSVESFLMRVADAIGMGVSCHELVWQLKDEMWLPTPVPVMTRELQYERDWTLSARNADYQYINTAEKPGYFLIHNPYTEASRPVDSGAFRAMIWYYLFKNGVVSFWVNGAERFGNPLILAHMQNGTDANQRGSIIEDLQNLASNTVGALAGQSTIEIIESKFQGSGAVWKDLSTYIDQQILIALGVSPDLILQGQNGSRSANETRDGIRLESSKMDAKLMWSAITRDCVRWIAHFNGFDPAVPMPIIESVFEDAIEISDSVINAGCATNNEVRKAAGLPAWSIEQGGENIASLYKTSPAPLVNSVGVDAPGKQLTENEI